MITGKYAIGFLKHIGVIIITVITGKYAVGFLKHICTFIPVITGSLFTFQLVCLLLYFLFSFKLLVCFLVNTHFIDVAHFG